MAASWDQLCGELFIGSFRITINSFADFLLLKQRESKHRIGTKNEQTANEPTDHSMRHEMPEACGKQIDERHRQHELPGEVHELIHAQPWQSAANPNKDCDQRQEFAEKPEVGRHPVQKGEGCVPAT